MDKTQEMLDLWWPASGLSFRSLEAEKAYKTRAQRIADVVQMKVPDRVPVSPSFGIFPALDNGFTSEECMFDYNKTYAAWMKALVDFEPEAFRCPIRDVFRYYSGFPGVLATFGSPEVSGAFKELYSAGALALKWMNFIRATS